MSLWIKLVQLPFLLSGNYMWKILILTVFISAQAHAMSFPTDQTWKKLKHEAKKEHSTLRSGQDTVEGLTPLQLFTSPLQPGGSYMLNINWSNLWSWLRMKSHKTLSQSQLLINKSALIERYAKVLVDCDDDVRALQDSPAFDNGWKAKLATLKAEKMVYYRAYIIRTN